MNESMTWTPSLERTLERSQGLRDMADERKLTVDQYSKVLQAAIAQQYAAETTNEFLRGTHTGLTVAELYADAARLGIKQEHLECALATVVPTARDLVRLAEESGFAPKRGIIMDMMVQHCLELLTAARSEEYRISAWTSRDHGKSAVVIDALAGKSFFGTQRYKAVGRVLICGYEKIELSIGSFDDRKFHVDCEFSSTAALQRFSSAIEAFRSASAKYIGSYKADFG